MNLSAITPSTVSSHRPSAAVHGIHFGAKKKKTAARDQGLFQPFLSERDLPRIGEPVLHSPVDMSRLWHQFLTRGETGQKISLTLRRQERSQFKDWFHGVNRDSPGKYLIAKQKTMPNGGVQYFVICLNLHADQPIAQRVKQLKQWHGDKSGSEKLMKVLTSLCCSPYNGQRQSNPQAMIELIFSDEFHGHDKRFYNQLLTSLETYVKADKDLQRKAQKNNKDALLTAIQSRKK